MLAMIGTKLGRWAMMALGFIGLLMGVWMAGRRAQRDADQVRYLEGYQRTRRNMDDAETDIGDGPDDARDFLLDRIRRRGGM